MPIHEPDATDPMELVGVGLPVADESSVREMAECFVEEYLRMRFEPDQIVRLFQRPFYAGAHRAWKILGEDEVRRMIDARAPLYRARRS